MTKQIEVEIQGRLATITFNQPEVMNAMDGVMMRELADIVTTLKNNSSVHIVLFRGAGHAFSAGGNVKAMLDPNGPMKMEDIMVDLSRLALAMYSMPQITIASVHGAAAGLGCSIAIACDFVIAEETSKIAMNFIGIGLVPDGGGHFFLKERVGTTMAKQLIWSGEVLDGKRAMQIGLIDQVVADGEAWNIAQQRAQLLLSSPTASMVASKKILHAVGVAELEKVVELEAQAQATMRKTADHQEGIRAFVEKRKPTFTGQ
ncbi:enoyl-CoA hydratase [Sporosarcina sp. PTS2304]|uniref:enoyl-CoA hydratase n=1 Tax=Sporosarcina sp. PTS2304 TaxID=2283194 RepID=UPI000E0D2919|nr:enoyl-CoA hydratase [Sporosarcina sp. PTS2304]AXH99902.1 enoyl-CoA hydratase [Sporosarcina sp. PTS2304]